jgi:hypothetical protein
VFVACSWLVYSCPSLGGQWTSGAGTALHSDSATMDLCRARTALHGADRAPRPVGKAAAASRRPPRCGACFAFRRARKPAAGGGPGQAAGGGLPGSRSRSGDGNFATTLAAGNYAHGGANSWPRGDPEAERGWSNAQARLPTVLPQTAGTHRDRGAAMVGPGLELVPCHLLRVPLFRGKPDHPS